MQILKSYIKFVDNMSEFFGVISQYLVLVTVFVGFGNVVLRYSGEFVGMRLTSNVLIESQWYLYTLIFFFGFPYILKHNINVRVDFWYAGLGQKTRAWIDLIGHFLALLPYTLLGIYVTWNPVLRSWGLRPDGSWGQWELSPDPNGLPRAPIKTMIIVAFVALFLQATVETIRLIAILSDQRELMTVAQREEHDAPLRIE